MLWFLDISVVLLISTILVIGSPFAESCYNLLFPRNIAQVQLSFQHLQNHENLRHQFIITNLYNSKTNSVIVLVTIVVKVLQQKVIGTELICIVQFIVSVYDRNTASKIPFRNYTVNINVFVLHPVLSHFTITNEMLFQF